MTKKLTDPSRHHREWAQAEIQAIHDGIAAGMSCTKVAEQLHRTKNSVMGKAKGLGLRFGTKGKYDRKGAGLQKTDNPRKRGKPPIGSPWRRKVVRSAPPMVRHGGVLMTDRSNDPGLEGITKAEGAAYDASRKGMICEDLGAFNCRWPIGDPKTPEFRFCGDLTHRLRGYCDHHHTRSINLDSRWYKAHRA